MTPEFSPARIATLALAELERRRGVLVRAADVPAAVDGALTGVLTPLHREYEESALPPAYWAALRREVDETLRPEWIRLATRFTQLEERAFGAFRGGDPLARALFVLVGLTVGGFVVWAPFIPIWEKWLPWALAVASWWLPEAQRWYHRRRYALELGALVDRVEARRSVLEAAVDVDGLLGGEVASAPLAPAVPPQAHRPSPEPDSPDAVPEAEDGGADHER